MFKQFWLLDLNYHHVNQVSRFGVLTQICLYDKAIYNCHTSLAMKPDLTNHVVRKVHLTNQENDSCFYIVSLVDIVKHLILSEFHFSSFVNIFFMFFGIIFMKSTTFR